MISRDSKGFTHHDLLCILAWVTLISKVDKDFMLGLVPIYRASFWRTWLKFTRFLLGLLSCTTGMLATLAPAPKVLSILTTLEAGPNPLIVKSGLSTTIFCHVLAAPLYP